MVLVILVYWLLIGFILGELIYLICRYVASKLSACLLAGVGRSLVGGDSALAGTRTSSRSFGSCELSEQPETAWLGHRHVCGERSTASMSN